MECHIKKRTTLKFCASAAINLETFQYATIQKYGAVCR